MQRHSVLMSCLSDLFCNNICQQEVLCNRKASHHMLFMTLYHYHVLYMWILTDQKLILFTDPPTVCLIVCNQ